MLYGDHYQINITAVCNQVLKGVGTGQIIGMASGNFLKLSAGKVKSCKLFQLPETLKLKGEN